VICVFTTFKSKFLLNNLAEKYEFQFNKNYFDLHQLIEKKVDNTKINLLATA